MNRLADEADSSPGGCEPTRPGGSACRSALPPESVVPSPRAIGSGVATRSPELTPAGRGSRGQLEPGETQKTPGFPELSAAGILREGGALPLSYVGGREVT